MIVIPLTQGYVMWASDEDAEEARKGWYAVERSRGVYAQRGGPNRKTLYFHCEILRPPAGLEVDHIRGTLLPGSTCILDNRRDNLRVCSKQQNKRGHMAKRVNASSKYRGVSWHIGVRKWHARIGVSPGTVLSLGFFDSEEDAARAYDTAAKYHFGEFASLNLPT